MFLAVHRPVGKISGEPLANFDRCAQRLFRLLVSLNPLEDVPLVELGSRKFDSISVLVGIARSELT